MTDVDWFSGGGSGKAVDVEAVLDCDGFGGLVECIQAGALVALGCTRDGGALGVTITVDGRWRREYFRDGLELTSWVAEALPAVRAATAAAQAASTGSGNGQRRRRGL